MDDSKIIKVDIRQDDIEHTISLGEFKELLKRELGSITWMTQGQYQKRIDAAVDSLIQKIRDSKYV